MHDRAIAMASAASARRFIAFPSAIPRFFSPLMRAACAALALAAIAAAGAITSAEAQERKLTEEQRAQIERHVEEIRARLNLSEEQRVRLEPVLRRSFEQRAEVLQRYGVSRDRTERLGFRKARALKSDLDAVRQSSEAEIAAILDERQMIEYRKIQEEMREELRARVRERRS